MPAYVHLEHTSVQSHLVDRAFVGLAVSALLLLCPPTGEVLPDDVALLHVDPVAVVVELLYARADVHILHGADLPRAVALGPELPARHRVREHLTGESLDQSREGRKRKNVEHVCKIVLLSFPRKRHDKALIFTLSCVFLILN